MIVFEDIAIAEMLKSDMESNQQKISVKKNLKQRTLTPGDHLNSPKEIDANNISNGFDTPFVQKSSVVSPPSPVRFSWNRRCTELIFRQSPEKPLMNNEDKAVVSDTSNVSNGQKHLTNDKPLDNVSKRQQMRFSFGQPKVILEVPSPAEDVNRVSDFESEIKKDVNGKNVPLLLDGRQVGRQKRGCWNLTNEVGDPLLDTWQIKKLRPEEQPIENPLYQGATCSEIPTQSDVSKVQQLSTLSNQTQGNTNTEGSRVVWYSIHISVGLYMLSCKNSDLAHLAYIMPS